MSEKIIVSLTSWSKRINNLPTVLNTILEQTVKPDYIVLNLAYGEVLPDNVAEYLRIHNVEIIRVADTKVYKKLIPTLKKYPNDIVITIDDDWLYPCGMIEDFMNIHQHFPNNPISGNHVVCFGMQCHCGCASLTKREFFGTLLDYVDDNLMTNCPSDDIVYTYLALSSGHVYVRTRDQYFTNMIPLNNESSYTKEVVCDSGIGRTFDYLTKRFGKIDVDLSSYLQDPYMAELVYDISESKMSIAKKEAEKKIRSTYAYRLGRFLLKPFSWIKNR